jgi:hypothetical protein
LVEPYLSLLVERDRLEEGAVVAERAQVHGDHSDLFRTVPLDHIQSHVTAAINCVHSTGDGRNRIGIILVAHPELAPLGPESARHYRWIFNRAGMVVMIDDKADIGDNSSPINLPHAAAAFTGHKHVVTERALMIEGNPGMVAWTEAPSIRDNREQCGRIG